jgi:hypothetical protein
MHAPFIWQACRSMPLHLHAPPLFTYLVCEHANALLAMLGCRGYAAIMLLKVAQLILARGVFHDGLCIWQLQYVYNWVGHQQFDNMYA